MFSNSNPQAKVAMPLLRYFLSVGTLLSLLVYGWSEYIEPPAAKTRGAPAAAKAVEIFRPTPAPPIVDAEQPSSAETAGPAAADSQRPVEIAKVQRAKPKKQRVWIARRRATPRDTFAYAPPRPFFFDLR
jgi:hypothetical protein